jgi:formimidoylglutamate deiminase
VELLADVGLLSPRFTGVHGIHLSEGEVALLGRARALVCACPSTERNLGDGVVPADALLAAGVRVSLGSDSQASIDLLDEARQLESHLRLVRLRRAVLDAGGGRVDGLSLRLLRAATVAGAESLGLDTGVLAPGRPADFFSVDLGHPALAGADASSLVPALVFGAPQDAVREVAVAGRFVVEEGRHPLAEESSRAFASLSRRLFS